MRRLGRDTLAPHRRERGRGGGSSGAGGPPGRPAGRHRHGTRRMLELFGPAPSGARGRPLARDAAPRRVKLAQADRRRRASPGDMYACRFPPARPTTVHPPPGAPLRAPAGAPRSPRRAAARPGGRLLIVDFAPHEREELRDRDAHLRLGFADEAMLNIWTAPPSRPGRRASRWAASSRHLVRGDRRKEKAEGRRMSRTRPPSRTARAAFRRRAAISESRSNFFPPARRRWKKRSGSR